MAPNAPPIPIPTFAAVLSPGDDNGGSGMSVGAEGGLEGNVVIASDVLVVLVDVLVLLVDVEDFGILVAVLAAELRVLVGSPMESRRNRPASTSQQKVSLSQQKSRGLEVTFSHGIKSVPPVEASATLSVFDGGGGGPCSWIGDIYISSTGGNLVSPRTDRCRNLVFFCRCRTRIYRCRDRWSRLSSRHCGLQKGRKRNQPERVRRWDNSMWVHLSVPGRPLPARAD